MRVETLEVNGLYSALHGMRNPMNSWERTDSLSEIGSIEYGLLNWYSFQKTVDNWKTAIGNKEVELNLPESEWNLEGKITHWLTVNSVLIEKNDVADCVFIGPKDMRLAQSLIKGGPVHAKFMRQIGVIVDITAPLYLWKELDTYKIGTVANSTSTMHKLASTPITLKCFEISGLNTDFTLSDADMSIPNHAKYIVDTIDYLERLRKKYLETKDVKYWKELIRWLPESWLQMRTVSLNYEVLRNIYRWRRYHKLSEWSTICDWIETLPYANELILYENIPK